MIQCSQSFNIKYWKYQMWYNNICVIKKAFVSSDEKQNY